MHDGQFSVLLLLQSQCHLLLMQVYCFVRFSLEIRDERIREQLDFLPIVLLRPAEELHLKLTLLN